MLSLPIYKICSLVAIRNGLHDISRAEWQGPEVQVESCGSSALRATSFSTWSLPAFMACIIYNVFDLALLGSRASTTTWPLLVLCDPLSVSAMFPFHPWFNPHMGLPSPGIISEAYCFSAQPLAIISHEWAGNSRSCWHYTRNKRGSGKLRTGHSSDYHVGVINYLWCYHLTLSLFTQLVQWWSNNSFIEFFVLEFFIHLPKILPYLWVQVCR